MSRTTYPARCRSARLPPSSRSSRPRRDHPSRRVRRAAKVRRRRCVRAVRGAKVRARPFLAFLLSAGASIVLSTWGWSSVDRKLHYLLIATDGLGLAGRGETNNSRGRRGRTSGKGLQFPHPRPALAPRATAKYQEVGMEKPCAPPMIRNGTAGPEAARVSAIRKRQVRDPMRSQHRITFRCPSLVLVASLALLLAAVPSAQARRSIVAPSSSSGVTVAAVADAYVSAAKPHTNFGSTTRLKAEQLPVERAYLRFDVGSLNAPVSRATLMLHTESSSTIGYLVQAVADNSWQESTVTYANAPALSGTATPSGGFASRTWTSID